MSRVPATAVVMAILLAGCRGAIGSDSPFGDGEDTLVAACPDEVTSDDGPADPDGDALGWEDGVWANEPVDVDRSRDAVALRRSGSTVVVVNAPTVAELADVLASGGS